MTTKKTNSSDQKSDNNKDNKVDVAPYLSKNNNNAKVNNTNNSGSGLKTAGILSLVVIVGTTAYVMFNNKGIDVAETTSTPDNIEQSNSEDQTVATTTKSDSPETSVNSNTVSADRPLKDAQLVNVESGILIKPLITLNILKTLMRLKQNYLTPTQIHQLKIVNLAVIQFSPISLVIYIRIFRISSVLNLPLA